MIGKKLRRLTGLLAALVLFACAIIPTTAFGDPVAATSATAVDNEYYKNTLGIKEDPSLTLAKYQSREGDSSAVDETKPIQGVAFKYAKVGGLYQVETGSGTVMAYGITTAFGQAIGFSEKDADYTVNGMDYWFFEDGAKIQTKTSGATASSLNADGGFLKTASSVHEGITGTTGKVTCDLDTSGNGDNAWGLYLVVETDVSGAKDASGKALSITKVQTPFLIALPTMMNNKTWDATIEAQIKNATDEATVEKKIIVSDNTKTPVYSLTDATDLDDTDTTSIGDTVWYRLKSTVPAVPAGGQKITMYILSDEISKGLDVNSDSFEVVTWDGTTETQLKRDTGSGTGDYTLDLIDSVTETEKAFENGSSFTIKFTEEGRKKLDTLAQSGKSVREVYVRYSATVNADAVIGPRRDGATPNSGNPNEVKLTYQVDGSAEMDTAFDRVTHFTFGIDVAKEFQGAENPGTLYGDVTFKVYTGSGQNKTYYTFEGVQGAYSKPATVTDKESATSLKLDGNGKIKIDGLELGTYYLEETATAEGYRLLNAPVEFKVESSDKTNNAFVGTASQYLGTLKNESSTSGRLSATVVNTKGFSLPSTGESGTLVFVLLGAAVFTAAGLFLAHTSKANKK